MLNGPKKSCLPSCLPCGIHKPVRNNYFDGRLLVTRDFVAEQDYHRGHRQVHNALLHGTGTVCGMKLIQHPSPDCQREFVVVEPGLALDCCGQEIMVPERILIRVREMIEADDTLHAALDGKNHLFIGIKRCDQGAEPMPVILSGCDGEGGVSEYGRIAEGFDFVVFARAPEKVKPVSVPVNPKLEWVHSFTLEAETPKALHVNEAEHQIQILADNSTGQAHTYMHDLETHDLSAMLEGPKAGSDSGSSLIGSYIFAAGKGFLVGGAEINGIGVWGAQDYRSNANPLAVIQTESDRPRIAVSPVSGVLFVLDLIDANIATLTSYSTEHIEEWLPDAGSLPASAAPNKTGMLDFHHGFGGKDKAPGRGAAMMQMSRDGQFLALACPVGVAKERLYLIDVATFNSGEMMQEDALAKDYSAGSTDHLETVAWSVDDQYLYVVTRNADDGGTILLNRFALTGDGNRVEKRGRGVLLEGTAFDMAIAPTETRAYLLMADTDGVTKLATIDLEKVRAEDATVPEALERLDGAIRLDGLGRNLALMPNGARAYVAIADDGEAPPDRGLVAVIDITEDDCGIKFDELIDDCPHCKDDGDHAVVLGHIEGYLAKDKPRMMDADEQGEDDVAIDNLKYREIVPSAATLREVIECILAQGVAEGPPGPRGDLGPDGPQGEEGAKGNDGEQGIQGDQGDQGLQGDQGIQGIQGNTGAKGAKGDPGPGLDPTNPIVGLSWIHGEPYPNIANPSEFSRILREQGVALAFERPVPWKFFTGSEKAGQTLLVELQHQTIRGQIFVWETISFLDAHPITDLQLSGTLLKDWTVLNDAALAEGFALRGESFDLEFDKGAVLRLVFYTDFVADEEGRLVDGTHFLGELPTGRGAPGDTFRSWFFVGTRDG